MNAIPRASGPRGVRRLLRVFLAALGLLPCALLAADPLALPKDTSTSQPMVGAYYYPWYRAAENSRGWMRQALRGRLVPRQMPKLGVYGSREPEVIADHIRQSRQGNIDFWAVSWWGPGSSTDKAFLENILPHPQAGQLKYAALYETTGRLGSMRNPDYSNLLPDIQYLAEHYFQHPQYLKINQKPVVFIYLTRAYFRQGGQDALAKLREALPNLYLVGDDVFGPRYRAAWAQPWDAITAYDVYGQSLSQAGATAQAVERLTDNYKEASQAAHQAGKAFIPAVSPGFNDRAVREGHAGRARYFKDAADSKEGDIFRALIQNSALPFLDPKADHMLMVTSFNEWYEDTQIEATTGTQPESSKDDSDSGAFYTEGDRYLDYGTLYLDILREETGSK